MHEKSFITSGPGVDEITLGFFLVALNVSLLWPSRANARNGVCLNKGVFLNKMFNIVGQSEKAFTVILEIKLTLYLAYTSSVCLNLCLSTASLK